MATSNTSAERTGSVARLMEPGVADRPALSDRSPRARLFPLAVFAATWVLILATWYWSDAIYGHRHPWIWPNCCQGHSQLPTRSDGRQPFSAVSAGLASIDH